LHPNLSQEQVLDIDTTIVVSHSEGKEGAAPTWKHTFGLYAQAYDWESLLGDLDRVGEAWDASSIMCGIHFHLSRDSLSKRDLYCVGMLLNNDKNAFVALADRDAPNWCQYGNSWADNGGKMTAGKTRNWSCYMALNINHPSLKGRGL